MEVQNRVLALVAKSPCDADLRHAKSLLTSKFFHAIDDGLVRLAIIVSDRGLEYTVAILTHGLEGPLRPCQNPTGDGRPRDNSESSVEAEGNHVALLFPGDQFMLNLH